MGLRPRQGPLPNKGKATPRDAERAVKAALERAIRDAAKASDARPVQLVGRLYSPDDYRKVRSRVFNDVPGWRMQWRDQPAGHYPLAVWSFDGSKPLPRSTTPYIAGPTVGFYQEGFLPPEGGLALGVALWLRDCAPEQLGPVSLAPPVLEVYAKGRARERRVVDFGMEYPLSAFHEREAAARGAR